MYRNRCWVNRAFVQHESRLCQSVSKQSVSVGTQPAVSSWTTWIWHTAVEEGNTQSQGMHQQTGKDDILNLVKHVQTANILLKAICTALSEFSGCTDD